MRIVKGKSHLASARILGDKPYYSRSSLAHDSYDSPDNTEKIRKGVKCLSYYTKTRDAVDGDDSGKEKDNKLFYVNKYLNFSLDSIDIQVLE